jgi:DNA-binding transcriptional LysR family regulator
MRIHLRSYGTSDPTIAMRTIVDRKSFSRAARQLKLPQGTVTGHVQSLEQQLGIRLLNRTTRKVSLTEEGAQFYQRCIRILAEFTEVENLAKSFQQAPRGPLRLNTDVTLARVIAPVVSEYVLSYPGTMPGARRRLAKMRRQLFPAAPRDGDIARLETELGG